MGIERRVILEEVKEPPGGCIFYTVYWLPISLLSINAEAQISWRLFEVKCPQVPSLNKCFSSLKELNRNITAGIGGWVHFHSWTPISGKVCHDSKIQATAWAYKMQDVTSDTVECVTEIAQSMNYSESHFKWFASSTNISCYLSSCCLHLGIWHLEKLVWDNVNSLRAVPPQALQEGHLAVVGMVLFGGGAVSRQRSPPTRLVASPTPSKNKNKINRQLQKAMLFSSGFPAPSKLCLSPCSISHLVLA